MVKVKALEWTPVSATGIDIEAVCAVGTYTMSFDSPMAGGATNLWLAGDDVDTFSVYEKITEALEVAQADFNERILSALEEE